MSWCVQEARNRMLKKDGVAKLLLAVSLLAIYGLYQHGISFDVLGRPENYVASDDEASFSEAKPTAYLVKSATSTKNLLVPISTKYKQSRLGKWKIKGLRSKHLAVLDKHRVNPLTKRPSNVNRRRMNFLQQPFNKTANDIMAVVSYIKIR